jgi:transcriptional regulator with XRE-family HTH domain
MTSQPAGTPASHTAGISLARRDLGRRLAAARKRAGYSQHAFAPLTGYARSTLSEIELGRFLPGYDFWERCEQVLGLAPGHLTAPYDRLAPNGPGRLIGPAPPGPSPS